MPQLKDEINQEAIARKLDLSKGTVSRALRNQPGIHPRTRSLVMETAAQMGYLPQRTRVQAIPAADHQFVGVLVRTPSSEWRNGAYLTGMADVANKLNVSLVLVHVGLDEADTVLDPAKQPPAMQQGILSGIVLVHKWPAHVVRILAARVPCVSLIHRVDNVLVDTIDIDHHGGMRQLADHLHALGHRRIGFFGHSADLTWANARFGGYVQGLYAIGLPFDPTDVIDMPTKLLEGVPESCDAQIDTVAERIRGGVRAWMASCNFAGYLLTKGLLERGFRIPEDVSITGFDANPWTDRSLPILTTVRYDAEQMGSQALAQIRLRMENAGKPRQSIVFDSTLVLGETTAPPSFG